MLSTRFGLFSTDRRVPNESPTCKLDALQNTTTHSPSTNNGRHVLHPQHRREDSRGWPRNLAIWSVYSLPEGPRTDANVSVPLSEPGQVKAAVAHALKSGYRHIDAVSEALPVDCCSLPSLSRIRDRILTSRPGSRLRQRERGWRGFKRGLRLWHQGMFPSVRAVKNSSPDRMAARGHLRNNEAVEHVSPKARGVYVYQRAQSIPFHV